MSTRFINFIDSKFVKGRLDYRILRFLTMLFLAVILSALIVLFQLAKTVREFSEWHLQLFIAACSNCFFIVMLMYYAKAKRDRTRKANDERYRSIIAISDMGAWEFHTETGELWCSPEYFQMLGYDEHTFRKHYAVTIEDAWINRLHPDDREAAVDKFAAFYSGSSNLYENTFRLRHRTGKWIWILSRSKVLRKPDGTRSKVMLGSHIDITEKINIQLELSKRNEKLMKFAFSNAHHVRGPVARMLGLAELSKIDKETDSQWYVKTICDEAHQLDKITRSIAKELDEFSELN